MKVFANTSLCILEAILEPDPVALKISLNPKPSSEPHICEETYQDSQTARESCSMWLLASGRLLLDGELLRDTLTRPEDGRHVKRAWRAGRRREDNG